MTTPTSGLDQYNTRTELICPHCNSKVMEDDDICISCGEFLITEEEQHELMREMNSQTRLPIPTPAPAPVQAPPPAPISAPQMETPIYAPQMETPTFGPAEEPHVEEEENYEETFLGHDSGPQPPAVSNDLVDSINTLNSKLELFIVALMDTRQTLIENRNEVISISNMYNQTMNSHKDQLSQLNETLSQISPQEFKKSQQKSVQPQSDEKPKRRGRPPKKDQTFLKGDIGDGNSEPSKLSEVIDIFMNIKGIGESRASKLFENGITSLEKMKNMRYTTKTIKACGGKNKVMEFKKYAKEHLEGNQ